MDRCQMDAYESWPEGVPLDIASLSSIGKQAVADHFLMKHLRHFGFASVSAEQQEDAPDHLFNYSNNLCHRALHLMHLNDMAKEGDLDRAVLSLKANLPFFYAHSARSKYFVECLDVLMKTLHTCSPQMRLRLLEGSFANKRGGKGQNVETDLLMEHSVRNKKEPIRSLGSNKRDQAIQPITMAADTVSDICTSLNGSLRIPKKTGYSSKIIVEEDELRVKQCLRELRPFTRQPGRTLGCLRVPASSVSTAVVERMKDHIKHVLTSLVRQPRLLDHVEEDNDDSNADRHEDDFDDLPDV